MTTARDLVTDALFDSGAYGQGDALNAADAALSLRVLQRMLDSWSNDNLTVYTTTDAVVSTVVGTATYALLGWSPNTRPVTIQNAYLRDGAADYPLDSLTEIEYDAIGYKAERGRPNEYFYKPTGDAGTFYTYPTPDAVYVLHIVGRLPLATGLTLNTTIAMPPGYERAIVKNLAMDLCDAFGVDPKQTLAMAASTSKAALANTNHRTPKLNVGFGSGFGADIRNDR